VPGKEIFEPFFAMMLVTFAVWVYMYIRRTSFLVSGRVDLRKVDTPAKMDVGVPADINLPAYALKNLFELPILFYALCLYLYVTGNVDAQYVIGSWLFVAGRLIHAVIYCAYNKVMHRFIAYFSSALVLWLMIVRAMIGAFGAAAT
jgi:hypothetical protein